MSSPSHKQKAVERKINKQFNMPPSKDGRNGTIALFKERVRVNFYKRRSVL